MRTDRIRVGAVELCVAIRGEGDLVALVPSVGGSEAVDSLSRTLEDEGFCAAAINLRGIGGSTQAVEGLTLHDLASDVGGVIEALNGAPAHLIGNAFGSRVARCLAADRPPLVRSLACLAAGGLVPPDPEAEAAFQDLFRTDLSEGGAREAFRKAMLSPCSDPYRYFPEGGSPPWCREAAALLFEAGRVTLPEAWLEGGRAPMLLLQGADDRLAPPANGRSLRERIGERASLVEIPRAGHLLLQEQPEAVAGAILSFLRAH
jgi:pimeloyl-ACP methyl ester carboxylesterase